MSLPKKTLSAVAYARYSTDMQNPNSLRDQIANCGREAGRHCWTVIETYEDAATSGSVLQRPAYQRMLSAIRSGLVKVVMAEALDRLSRDQADTAELYKLCQFHDVRIHTVHEGEISALHVGISSTMNALQLEEIARKTHRGLKGRVEDGRSGGGRCYGYRVPVGEQGLPIVGELEIVPHEAAVIVRIMQAFASGASPRAIAAALNEEGIASPHGGHWKANTIYGNRQRGTGILNNELYVGTRVWNRLRYRKNPDTRRRVSKLRDPSEWLHKDVPDLRIVDDALWQAVKARQDRMQKDSARAGTSCDENRLGKQDLRRNKYLLSGLLVCGRCGGRLTIAGPQGRRGYYCANHKEKGTAVCAGMPGIRQDDVERIVLDRLRHDLMQPEAVEKFRKAFIRHWHSQVRERRADQDVIRAELRTVERNIAEYITAIERGVHSPALYEKLKEAERRQQDLSARIADLDVDLPKLPDDLDERYQAAVDAVSRTLSRPGIVQRASESLGRMIDRIVVRKPDDGPHDVEVVGDIVGLLVGSDPERAEAYRASERSLRWLRG